jgi:hypothetical protein
VSYDATTNLNLNDQTVHDSDSITLNQQGGGYALTVEVPECSYQLDFVYGDVIENLDPATYHGQNRYISGAQQSRECPVEVPFFPSTGALVMGVLGSLGAVGLLLHRRK